MRKPKSIIRVAARRCPTVAYGFDAFRRWVTSTHLAHQAPANDQEPPAARIEQHRMSAIPRMSEVLCCGLIGLTAILLGAL